MEVYYIYQIKCKDTEIKDFYIGSTRHFGQRLISHKHASKHNSNFKLYQFINKNGGWENWEMILFYYFGLSKHFPIPTRQSKNSILIQIQLLAKNYD